MIVAHTDGGSRGNPGPAGYGVVVADEQGAVLAELHGSLGVTTNNVAEYEAVLAALRYAIEHGHRDLRIRSDSLLLVQQMRGVYRVKHPALQALYEDARRLAGALDRVEYEHVPRGRNAVADGLANRAMNAAAVAGRR